MSESEDGVRVGRDVDEFVEHMLGKPDPEQLCYMRTLSGCMEGGRVRRQEQQVLGRTDVFPLPHHMQAD